MVNLVHVLDMNFFLCQLVTVRIGQCSSVLSSRRLRLGAVQLNGQDLDGGARGNKSTNCLGKYGKGPGRDHIVVRK